MSGRFWIKLFFSLSTLYWHFINNIIIIIIIIIIATRIIITDEDRDAV